MKRAEGEERAKVLRASAARAWAQRIRSAARKYFFA